MNEDIQPTLDYQPHYVLAKVIQKFNAFGFRKRDKSILLELVKMMSQLLISDWYKDLFFFNVDVVSIMINECNAFSL